MLAYKVVFWSKLIPEFRNTPDNLTLVNRFNSGRVYLLVQGGGQFAASLRCHPPPPASGVSGGGRYATGHDMGVTFCNQFFGITIFESGE